MHGGGRPSSGERDGSRRADPRVQVFGGVVLLLAGLLTVGGSVVVLVADDSPSMWQVVLVVVGLVYLALGTLQLRRHRAHRAAQGVLGGSSLDQEKQG